MAAERPVETGNTNPNPGEGMARAIAEHFPTTTPQAELGLRQYTNAVIAFPDLQAIGVLKRDRASLPTAISIVLFTPVSPDDPDSAEHWDKLSTARANHNRTNEHPYSTGLRSVDPTEKGNLDELLDESVNLWKEEPATEVLYIAKVNSDKDGIHLDELEVLDSPDIIQFSRGKADTEVQTALAETNELEDANARRAEIAGIEHLQTLAGIPEIQGFYIQAVDGKFTYVYVADKLDSSDQRNTFNATLRAHANMLNEFNASGIPTMGHAYEEGVEGFDTFIAQALEREKEKIASGQNGAQIFSGVKFVE